MRNEAISILVGKRLRMRRRLLQLTQTQVAARCGLTFQQIHKYEAGLVDLSLVRLLVLTNVLRTPLSEILEGLQTFAGPEDRPAWSAVSANRPRADIAEDRALPA